MATAEDGATALHRAAAGEHREACALLLEFTPLPMQGPNAKDKNGQTPLDVAETAAFRDELSELHNATRLGASSGAVKLGQMHNLAKSQLLHGRYHVYQRVGDKVRLAEDVRSHRAVALKFAEAEAAEHEASTPCVVGLLTPNPPPDPST
jgi:hypothetical protein